MFSMRTRRRNAAVVGGVGLALVLAACSSGGGTDDESTGSTDCAAYKQYGDLDGKTVSVYTSIVDPEAKQQTDSYKPFEECTGAKIKYVSFKSGADAMTAVLGNHVHMTTENVSEVYAAVEAKKLLEVSLEGAVG